MKKASLYILAIVSAVMFSSMTIASSHVAAASPPASTAPTCKDASVLGFAPWYRCLTDASGNVVSPTTLATGGDKSGLQKFIWTIVLNLLDDFLRVVGWASVVYLIYGGFKYMMSQGSSDGMAKAKTTILNAIIGLVISILSIAIVNLAVGAFQ